MRILSRIQQILSVHLVLIPCHHHLPSWKWYYPQTEGWFQLYPSIVYSRHTSQKKEKLWENWAYQVWTCVYIWSFTDSSELRSGLIPLPPSHIDIHHSLHSHSISQPPVILWACQLDYLILLIYESLWLEDSSLPPSVFAQMSSSQWDISLHALFEIVNSLSLLYFLNTVYLMPSTTLSVSFICLVYCLSLFHQYM